VSWVESVWHGRGAAAVVARAALAPLSAVYGTVIAARNARYDRGLGVRAVACPALSVGNLTVGGTGKTPVAAWFARALQAGGGRPALVMRGYGDDEWRVHALLSPTVPVVRDADRVRGIASAAAAGADCIVLDDAFQHRRARRVVDVVLVAADGWTGDVRLLPSGPYREPLASLRRADLVVITVKSATTAAIDAVRTAVRAAVGPERPVAVMALEADALRQVTPTLDAAASAPLARLAAGHPVLAISAIGDPAAFERSLTAAGATILPRRFRDHHAFSASDANALARAVPAGGVAVCTLKDAVKLAPLWPHAAQPLWYLSQTPVVRDGADALAGAVQQVLAARNAASPTTRSTAG
jgi:tetraacyldisaccharide 4'-kinase